MTKTSSVRPAVISPDASSPTTLTTAPSAMLIGMLALLAAIAPLATDMYLPAFPAMAKELGVPATTIQFTLTTFLIGLAVGQLLIGPLSDRLGRRGLLIAGSVLCGVAGAACALAPSAELLIVFRFLQGFGGAAGVVLSRAVISDRSAGTATAKLFGLMMIIQGVAPVVGPILGGSLLGLGGWRVVFWALTAIAALTLAGLLAFVPESLPPAQRRSGGLQTLAHDARYVFGNAHYLGYTLAFAFSMAALFSYISASPFVLQNMLGLSTTSYSVAFAVNALGLMAVSALNSGLIDRYGSRRLLSVGLGLLLASSLLLLLDVTALHLPLWPTLLLLFAAVSSLGLILGNASSLAIAEVRRAAGTGSALLGALQFGLAALVSPLVGLAGEHSAVPMGLAMLASALIAVAALLLTRGPQRRAV